MKAKRPIRIILVDDHSLVRDGIKSLLEEEEDLQVIDEASGGEEALRKAAEQHPDILIVDIRMPGLSGIETTQRLREHAPGTRALVLSMHDSDDYVLRSIEAGAYGYLLKDTSREEFIKAIHAVQQGETYFSGDISRILVDKYLEQLKPGHAPSPATRQAEPSTGQDYELTKKEKEVLRLVVSGLSNKDIAQSLGNSVRTIETHRFNLMKKMGVSNLIELSRKARESGLVPS